MYLLMIAINLTYLFLINRYEKDKIQSNTMHTITILSVTLIMAWGSVISLMDQRLYGQLMVFMVNMMVCSIIYYLDAKGMSIPFLTSTIILAIALPYFQTTSNVLIGHYVNLAVFITISWMTSRIIYRNYCNNYIFNRMMNQSNSLLEKEMQENAIMNEKLSIANAQLKKLALMDELTELPNRRSFREFMDQKISHAEAAQVMSVIMIDVDYFKQYNDFYGHENGDLALIAIAGQLKDMIESPDHIAVRWGGEEFIYAAFHTNQDDIIGIANAIRLKILDLKIPNDSSATYPYLTISMGTCTAILSSAKEIEKIISAADRALYQAKKNGRNCVATCAEDERVSGAAGSTGLGQESPGHTKGTAAAKRSSAARAIGN
jgi:diguanylate cyclase (GGDEF)-like protein